MDSTSHLAAILDTVGEGVVTVDADQRIVLVNREAEAIFGYSRDELIGRSVQQLIPERYRAPHDAAFRRRTRDPANGEPTYRELEGLRKDGTHFPIELRFTHVPVDGAVLFTAAVRDITERVRAREEIARLNAELAKERDYLREEVRATGGFGEIVGDSAALRMTLAQVEAVAKTDATVLILGESGAGKELIARAIHEQSTRAPRPLVRVNCASIPESLFESEFFGHRKGAFTGAVLDREGRFQLADGGTIFLDEIGEVPLGLQAKLLRVLQERQFEPVGSDRTRTVDVRVIAATNRELQDEVAAGRFREDLFYRLGVFPIRLPPLRERDDDVLLLAGHFLQAAAARLNVGVPNLTRGAAEALRRYDWPGNVRELQNVLERGVILSNGGPLRASMLGLEHVSTARRIPQTPRAPRPEPDAEAIQEALTRQGGVVSRAAADLGLSRQSLYRRMERFGISPTP